MQKFIPRLWPIYNIIAIINLSNTSVNSQSNSENTSPNNKSNSVLFQIISRELAVITYLSIAIVVYYYGYSSNITFNYVIFVIFRDLLITYIFYGGYHWFMYKSKYSTQLKPYKFNPEYPSQKQLNHDRFYTLTGSIFSSIFEIIIFYLFQNQLYTQFWTYPFYSIIWLEFINHCRSIHFYWTHRIMHPWKYKIYGIDFGKILYSNIHSLHHKSYNTLPWSGLSMHPIEHMIYFTSIFIPLMFGITQHPIHILTHKYHTLISPIAGHDGFDFPGGGSMFHFLHHSQFECNYGTASIFWNFDKWFGTYRIEKK
eukprot:123857_1